MGHSGVLPRLPPLTVRIGGGACDRIARGRRLRVRVARDISLSVGGLTPEQVGVPKAVVTDGEFGHDGPVTLTYKWRGDLVDRELFELTESHGGRPAAGWWGKIRPHSLGWLTTGAWARRRPGRLRECRLGRFRPRLPSRPQGPRRSPTPGDRDGARPARRLPCERGRLKGFPRHVISSTETKSGSEYFYHVVDLTEIIFVTERSSPTIKLKVQAIFGWDEGPFKRQCPIGSCPGSRVITGTSLVVCSKRYGLIGRSIFLHNPRLMITLDGVHRRTLAEVVGDAATGDADFDEWSSELDEAGGDTDRERGV